MAARMGFAFSFRAGDREKYALIFCRSVRMYAGRQKSAPIFALVPGCDYDKLDPKTVAELNSLDAEVISFGFTPPSQEIHYAFKTQAAGAAEMFALDKVEQLIYCDAESLFLNDPGLMSLPRGKKLGVRPVDVKNIGLLWSEPVDEFWAHIYRLHEVPEENIFPVYTTVDYTKLRAYFNACLLTVRPEDGLLQKWTSSFLRFSEDPVWNGFFNRDFNYRVFLHQAILTGTLLAVLTEEEFEIYSIHVNFPLHFYARHPRKPEWIDDLVTCRLDLVDAGNSWKTWLPMREPLRSWLLSQYDELAPDTTEPIQL